MTVVLRNFLFLGNLFLVIVGIAKQSLILIKIDGKTT